MENMMKKYLGNDYTNDHLKNFCLYWMKGMDTMPKWEDSEEGRARYNAWRKENDLDCLYFDGDLRADTLICAWTPIKWVADCLNSEKEMKFYKHAKDKADPDHYLKLLMEDRDVYLPPKHELTQLLDHFLELAEQRCNYILLPDRDMNCARYNCYINGKKIGLYDEVPVMLYHLFDEEWFGKYYKEQSFGAIEWVKQENLECGFVDGIIDKEHVIPLIKGLPVEEAKWMTSEEEIKEALLYMINLLEKRTVDLSFVLNRV